MIEISAPPIVRAGPLPSHAQPEDSKIAGVQGRNSHVQNEFLRSIVGGQRHRRGAPQILVTSRPEVDEVPAVRTCVARHADEPGPFFQAPT